MPSHASPNHSSPGHSLSRFFLCVLAPALSLLLLSLPVGAQGKVTGPNWDRAMALRTAAMGDDPAQRNAWFSLLREGKHDALLQSLKAFSAAGTLSSPVREQQLFLFTIALADFPPQQVPAGLLEFLANYAPQTLVAHEENEDSAVALFNIPAAAQGVRFALTRQQAESRAAAMLAAPPEHWTRNYLDASPQERVGFLAALDFATREQLSGLNRNTQDSLSSQPALTAVAARTALALADVESMRRVLELGSGAEITSMLRAAAATLPGDDRAELLLACIESAPAPHAALAIALLAPGLQAVPQIISTLFDLLENPELGSAAALALARIDSPDIRAQLFLLSGSQGLAASRARMAINPGETASVQGVHP